VENSDLGHPIEDVNKRIDRCIKADAPAERVLWGLLTVMFGTGLFVLIYGVLHGNSSLIGFSLGTNGLCIWPILRLIKLHGRKTALRVIPSITALLSPRDAAREIHSLVKHLLDKP